MWDKVGHGKRAQGRVSDEVTPLYMRVYENKAVIADSDKCDLVFTSKGNRGTTNHTQISMRFKLVEL